MPPAERGVGVDEHMLVLLGDAQNFFEDRPAQRVQPGDRQVENAARRDIGGLGVHHLADVADLQIMPRRLRRRFTASRYGPLSTPTCPVTIARI